MRSALPRPCTNVSFLQMLPNNFPKTDIALLAESTPGFSGSDLKEMCRDASMVPLREYLKEHGGSHAEMVKCAQEVGLP